MQFCKDCGGVLNLFGKDERELCPACIQNQSVNTLNEVFELAERTQPGAKAKAQQSLRYFPQKCKKN